MRIVALFLEQQVHEKLRRKTFHICAGLDLGVCTIANKSYPYVYKLQNILVAQHNRLSAGRGSTTVS